MDVATRYVFETIETMVLCPMIDRAACDAGTLEDHFRRQRVDWVQLDPGVTVGLGRGFQLSLSLPLQLQIISTRYETLADGDRFEPTYEGVLPATRLVGGMNDGQIMAWSFHKVGSWTLGGGLGHSLPLGRVPTNPFESGDDATSQPFQSGTGTVVPSATFVASSSAALWGGWIGVRTSIPVVANRDGYLAPWTVATSMGPSVQPIPELQLLLTVDPMLQGHARWDGQPVGGRFSLMAGLNILGTVTPSVVLQGRVAATILEQPFVSSQEIVGPVLMASLGVSWTSRKGRRN